MVDQKSFDDHNFCWQNLFLIQQFFQENVFLMCYFEIITDKIAQCLMMYMHTHSHTNNTDTHTYIHTGGGDWFGPKFDHKINKHPLIKTNYIHMPIDKKS